MGDQNTRYFHQSTLKRRRQNRIVALQDDDDQWIYDEELLKNNIILFYSNLYSSASLNNEAFNSVSTFPIIKESDKSMLAGDISLVEVRRALFSMGNYKSPGPDGYHPIFFKSQWDIVGSSIFKMVQECFSEPEKIGDINQTLLTLIPKCDDPSKVKHLRPTALCNVSYKIVSKIITQRLKSVMPYVVSPNQSSFIPRDLLWTIFLFCKRLFTPLITLRGKKGL